jgi:hypothetical protein
MPLFDLKRLCAMYLCIPTNIWAVPMLLSSSLRGLGSGWHMLRGGLTSRFETTLQANPASTNVSSRSPFLHSYATFALSRCHLQPVLLVHVMMKFRRLSCDRTRLTCHRRRLRLLQPREGPRISTRGERCQICRLKRYDTRLF